MRFIPFDSFVIETKFTADEIRSIIEKNLDNTGFRLFSRPSRDRFSGYTLDKSFNIDLNNFRRAPMINVRGEILPNTTGSLIEVKARFSLSMTVIMIADVFISFIVFINITPGILKSHHIEKSDIQAYLIIVVFYAMLFANFNVYNHAAKQKLIRMLDGVIQD